MISSATAEHYVWGAGCDGWHLVQQPGLSVIQERMPPGTFEVRHLHHTARQCFFVLAGMLEIEHAGQCETLAAQQGCEIAPGVAHQVRNAADADAVFLVISQPPSHGDRMVIAER